MRSLVLLVRNAHPAGIPTGRSLEEVLETAAKQHHNPLERKTEWFKWYFFLGDYFLYHWNSKRGNSSSHRQLSFHLYSRQRSWINQWLLQDIDLYNAIVKIFCLYLNCSLEIQLSLLPMFQFSKTIPSWSKLGLQSSTQGAKQSPSKGAICWQHFISLPWVSLHSLFLIKEVTNPKFSTAAWQRVVSVF